MVLETTEEDEGEEEEEQNNNKKNKKKKRTYKINDKTNRKLIGLGALEDPERIRQIALQGALASHQTRGLQAADQQTRKRVAKLGGAATRESYHVTYYSELGKKGGNAVLSRYSLQYFQDIGRMKKKKKKNKSKKKDENKK